MEKMTATPRLRLRSVLVLVAVAAVPLAVWSEYRSPARQWKKALRDERYGRNRLQIVRDGVQGKVPGIGRDVATAELLDALGDPRAAVRDLAIDGLESRWLAADAAVPSLARLVVQDPETLVRYRAAMALGNMLEGSKSTRSIAAARPALVEALADRQDLVRTAAAGALLRAGEDELALPTLIRAIEDLRKSEDRFHGPAACAFLALGKVGARARPAIPSLLDFVGDFSPRARLTGMREHQRMVAAKMLVRLGERDAALRVLQKARDEQDDATRKAAAALIAGLDTPDRKHPVASGPPPDLGRAEEIRLE